MQKIVISTCYGGFKVSKTALLRLQELGNEHALAEPNPNSEHNFPERGFLHHIPRDNPQLVQVIEELEEEASGRRAALIVVEIPDDVEWIVEEYDGKEWIAEKHRTWY